MGLKIAILTSGGDAPGMNAALRALVRTLASAGHQVYGIERGYQGLIDRKARPLSLRSVANMIQKGGTFLKTSRCDDFKEKEGRKKAYDYLVEKQVNCLFVLGGDGSLKGLEIFNSEYPDITCVGIPCTIDNDYRFSLQCIGVDTATNTAMTAIDKVRDTAGSHERTFVIEVMGRRSSYLAYNVALAAGAESVVDLSNLKTLDVALDKAKESAARGKLVSLIVVLESAEPNVEAATVVKEKVRELGLETRALVLGHLQRGGAPSASDRMLASRLSYEAAKCTETGQSGVVVMTEQGEICFRGWKELKEVGGNNHEISDLIDVLSN